jgi:hypothetical protein
MRAQEKVATLLGSATVNLQNGDAKSIAYTVPAGKSAVVLFIVVRNPTASLAGGTDFNFGGGADGETPAFKSAVDLSGMTGTDDYYVITNNNAVITDVFSAGEEIGVDPQTGATADADATLDVFGYEF